MSDTLSTALHLLKPSALVRQGDCVYIGTESGVYTYSLQDGTLKKLVELPTKARIHGILCQMFNRIWIATEGSGLYMYDIKAKKLFFTQIKAQYIPQWHLIMHIKIIT